jgi:glutathione S-transferase
MLMLEHKAIPYRCVTIPTGTQRLMQLLRFPHRTVPALVGRTVFNVNPRTERKLLAELPGLLDRIDGWIEAGVLYGERLYSADYMMAPSLALLMYRRDVAPEIQARPAGALADRVLPEPPRSSGK